MELPCFSVPPPSLLRTSRCDFTRAYVAGVQRRGCIRADSCVLIPKRLAVYCGRRNSGGRENKRRGDGRRPNRVGEMLRREISPIIDDAFARAFSFEYGGKNSTVMVSVIDVRCSDDLRNARVSVSVLGTDEQKTQALQWLRTARKEIRFELAQRVHLKYMPELSFAESELAQAVKTVNILNMLAREREEKSVGPGQSVRGSEAVPAGANSLSSAQGLDLDASDDNAIMVDDLDEDGDDPLIIDVTDEDEDLEGMPDDELRRILFKTMGDDNIDR